MAVSGLLVNTKASDFKEQPKIKEVEKDDLKAESQDSNVENKGKILAISLASLGIAVVVTSVSGKVTQISFCRLKEYDILQVFSTYVWS